MHPELADLDRPEPDALHLPGLTGVRDIKGRIGMWRALLDRPLTSYYLVLGITILLLGLGLVMVQSTGSVADLAAGLSPYSDFKKQLLGAAVGPPLMWVAARSSPPPVPALAPPPLPARGLPAARGSGGGARHDAYPRRRRIAERRVTVDHPRRAAGPAVR